MDCKIIFDKIQDFLRKNCFIVLGFILILFLAFNGYIYYNYIYLTLQAEPQVEPIKLKIDKGVLNEVIVNIEAREDNLLRIQKNTYKDPFN